MSALTDLRIRVIHWLKKYGKIIAITAVVIGVIYTINRFLIATDFQTSPNTTYTPEVSVMDTEETAPKRVQTSAEKMIEEYVGYCNEGNYQKAFNMLSEDCQKYGFENSVSEFTNYVLKKMLTPKKYSIQNYSNYNGYYIYEIKYTDDYLATGLTNQEYRYSTEKIVFKKNKNSYDMSVGNFIKYDKIANISENDYLKVDVVDRITKYSTEIYTVKFTNRTDSTVVVSDKLAKDEVRLVLPQEYRDLENINDTIILGPGESKTCVLGFAKFFDDGDISQGILFGAVRVIENYKGVSGTAEEQQKEIDNAIAKFSVQIPVK